MITIIGSGFYGATIAHQLANVGHKVLILEKRDHIGGNAFTYDDNGINVHKYGSHIFHTKHEEVWNFINQFTKFNNYRHKVIVNHNGCDYPFPINLETINKFFKKRFMPSNARKFIESKMIKGSGNLKERAISQIGEELYNAFIDGYTYKQWGMSPDKLPASIINRIPVRYNFDSNYFSDPHEGIPVDGYTPIFNAMLDHKNITVETNVDFFKVRDQIKTPIVYSGPLDEYFNYEHGVLGWRSLNFEIQRHDVRDYQGNSVINYADKYNPYTRTHEFKHYHPEKPMSNGTTVMHESPANWQMGIEPYYPIRQTQDMDKMHKYQALVRSEKDVHFGGRLGSYAYLDMDATIKLALDKARLLEKTL